ncbi:MAG TPA: hypothetical protein VG101_06630 [Puia sp.]|nr:hypothetical protein [Puia sp.]
MNTIQVEQKSYEMPPRVGFTVAHFLTVADIDRSARYYETVFGAVATSAIRTVISSRSDRAQTLPMVSAGPVGIPGRYGSAGTGQ